MLKPISSSSSIRINMPRLSDDSDSGPPAPPHVSSQSAITHHLETIFISDDEVTDFRETPEPPHPLTGRCIDIDNETPADVIIIVGPDNVIYRLHNSTLSAESSYFSRLSLDGFDTDTLPEVSLPTLEPKVFELALHWMYQKNVPFSPPGQHFALSIIAKLLAAADTLDIPSLKLHAVDLAVNLLSDPAIKTLVKSERFREEFTIGTKLLFDEYRKGENLEHVLNAICDEGWVSVILESNELKEMLMEFSVLSLRLLRGISNWQVSHSCLEGSRGSIKAREAYGARRVSFQI